MARGSSAWVSETDPSQPEPPVLLAVGTVRGAGLWASPAMREGDSQVCGTSLYSGVSR